MNKFPQTGKTRGGYKYWIDHVNNDGSMCGRIEIECTQYSSTWLRDGTHAHSFQNGTYMKFGIVPPNEAAELLAQLKQEQEFYRPGALHIAVTARLLNDITTYLKHQSEKSE